MHLTTYLLLYVLGMVITAVITYIPQKDDVDKANSLFIINIKEIGYRSIFAAALFFPIWWAYVLFMVLIISIGDLIKK